MKKQKSKSPRGLVLPKSKDEEIRTVNNERLWEKFNYMQNLKTADDYKKIAGEIIEWAELDSTVVFSDFATERRFAPARVYEWAARSKEVADAISIAKHRIGSRREKMGLQNLYNANLVAKTMAIYNDDYKSWVKEIADKDANQERKITVEVLSMPSTTVVPDHKDNSEDEDEVE